MKRLLNWLTAKDNREAALAIVTIVTALAGGGWFVYEQFLRPTPPKTEAASNQQTITIGTNTGDIQQNAPGATAIQNSPGAVINISNGFTFEDFEAFLKEREAQLRADLEHAEDEKATIQTQLDETRRQMADAETSYKDRIAELEHAMAALDELAADLPQAQLDAARAALAEGDTSKADAIFEQIREDTADDIKIAAAAAFEQGKLAESDIRWADAATHYSEAARLDPTFGHLLSARSMAWLSADYRMALRHGEDLITAAIFEFGESSPQHADALNEHALTLWTTGHYDEAEPLFRKAIAIGKVTIGKKHFDYAARLNNLAILLEAARRYDEAEPLHREAIAIGEAALGKGHPDYAKYISNLAELLRATGRYGEAEPLYREAITTIGTALGKDHPAYATRLNNLALLLNATDRTDEAETLYHEAMSIVAAALGVEHPNYAKSLTNLAVLLHDSGRYDEAEPLYREALAVFEATLGPEHPHTKIVAGNLAGFEAAKQADGGPPQR